MAAYINTRCAHGEGIDLVVIGKLIAEAAELAAAGDIVLKLKALGEAELGKAYKARFAV